MKNIEKEWNKSIRKVPLKKFRFNCSLPFSVFYYRAFLQHGKQPRGGSPEIGIPGSIPINLMSSSFLSGDFMGREAPFIPKEGWRQGKDIQGKGRLSIMATRHVKNCTGVWVALTYERVILFSLEWISKEKWYRMEIGFGKTGIVIMMYYNFSTLYSTTRCCARGIQRNQIIIFVF